MTDKIRPFVFSCDAHVAEPPELFVKAMPDHLKQYVIHSEADGDVLHAPTTADELALTDPATDTP